MNLKVTYSTNLSLIISLICIRYDDIAFRRWSSICIGVDFPYCHVKYYIDGIKVGDEDLVETWNDLCFGVNPKFPTNLYRIKSGQHMVGDLTNINVYSGMLTDDEMEKVEK